MKKITIKIGIIGYLPFDFNRKMIKQWKSNVFEVIDDIEEYHIHNNSDTGLWSYSDDILEKELPTNYNADFFIGITYVPIGNNYYARRLNSNRVVLSYFEMYQIIKQENIPIENLLLRILYACTLVYLRSSNQIPIYSQWIGFFFSSSPVRFHHPDNHLKE